MKMLPLRVLSDARRIENCVRASRKSREDREASVSAESSRSRQKEQG